MSLTENDIRKLPLTDKDLDSIDKIKEVVYRTYSVGISGATAEKIRLFRISN